MKMLDMMLSTAVVTTGCLVLLAGSSIALAGCAVLPERSDQPPELIEPIGVEVDLIEVKRGTLIIEMNGTGVVVPSITEYQYFEIDGQLGEGYVEPGEIVRKGDLLFQLNSGNDDMQLLQQRLTVEKRRMAMDSLFSEEFNDDQQDNKWLAGINYKIEQMRLDQMLERHNKRTIAAAHDGIVTFVDDIKIGGTIKAYRPIVGIARKDQLQLRYVGDVAPYLMNIRLGDEVELLPQGKPASQAVHSALGFPMKGTIAAVPAMKPIDSTLPRASVLAKTIYFDLGPDMMTVVEIGEYIPFRLELIRKENALIIPRGALRNYQGRDFVLIAEGEMLREVEVQRGIVTQTEAEIVEGLTEGQQIVVAY